MAQPPICYRLHRVVQIDKADAKGALKEIGIAKVSQ